MSITFDKVMDFHREHNKGVFAEIRDNLDQLLPFVGEGLTQEVYGSWPETLLEFCGRIVDQGTRAVIVDKVNSGDYLTAAQLLEVGRGKVNWKFDLIHHFSSRKFDERWDAVQSGAVSLLPYLFRCPILTTNLDPSIELTYRKSGVCDIEVLGPTSHEFQSHAVRLRNTPCVFKLYGKIVGDMTDSDKLAITKEQYDRHYGGKGDACDSLRAFVDARAMIFLGCDLKRGQTIEFLREVVEPNTLHYAIVGCKSSERDARIRELAKANIRVIVYEEGQRESVRVVLEELLKITDPAGYENMLGRARRTYELSPEELDIVKSINKRIARQRDNHPSFRLLQGEPDEKLMPRGEITQLIPNSQRLVKTDDNETVFFRNFIQDNFSSNEQKHLLITGRGGIGKTVALLTFATDQRFIPKGVPAIYIPFYDLAQYADQKRACIDSYIRDNFNPRESALILKLSYETWGAGPSVILLLDGHNEVPIDKEHNVDEGIRAWVERPGAQLVTTSRIPHLFGIARIQSLELQELAEREVTNYLTDRKVPLPSEDSSLWRVLETPLMLRLYVDGKALPHHEQADYLDIAPSDNAGHLVWNYLQRELWRMVDQHGDNFSKAEYAMAIMLVIPYVCWKMASSNEFKVSSDKLNEYIDGACSFWSSEDRPCYFKNTEHALNAYVDEIAKRTLVGSQRQILTKEVGLLRASKAGYSLLHQSLRDGFAAIHLRNVIEAMRNTLPEEFKSRITGYVTDFLTDLVDSGGWDAPLLNIWEKNRTEQPTNTGASYNLLRVLHRHFNGNLSTLNWSGMDIRDINLYRFRNEDMRMMLSSSPSNFVGTWLDIRCFMPQGGHSGVVRALCFTSDGSKLASGADDNVVRLWDAATGFQLAEFKGHNDRIRTVCFSSDGVTLASGSDDGTVRLWNTTTCNQTKVFGGNGGHVWSICMSSDNSMLAGGSSDGCIYVWDISKEEQTLKLSGHRGGVRSICFCRDNMLVSGSDDETVRLWSISDNKQKLELGSHDDWIWSICLSPDNTILVSGSWDGTIRFWSMVTYELIKELKSHGGGIRMLSYSRDGTTIASGHSDGFVRLWEASSGRQVAKLKGNADCGWSVGFSPDGYTLATGSTDGSIYLWDATRSRQVTTLGEADGRVLSTRFSSFNYPTFGNANTNFIRPWDAATVPRAIECKECVNHVSSVCLSPDGSMLATGLEDGTVRLFDVATNQQVSMFEGDGDAICSLCFSDDCSKIVTGSNRGLIRQRKVNGGKETAVIETRVGRIHSICLSPDGRILASGTSDGIIRLWRLSAETGREPAELRSRSGAIYSLCFSPDGSKIASGSIDNTLRIWNAATHVQEARFVGDIEMACSLCFSPDGTTIAGGHVNGTVSLWNAVKGKSTDAIGGHGGWVKAVRYSSDGSTLTSVSNDGVMCLWDVRNSIKDDNEHNTFLSPIEPLHNINLMGLNLSQSHINSERNREILRHNGVIV